MKKEKRIIDLNKKYSKDLSEWANVSENLNDDALLKMLQNLMKEYEIKSENLLKEFKFKNDLYKRRRKICEKDEKLALAYDVKQSKFRFKRQKRLNRKLFSLFKRKIKLDMARELLARNNEFNAYVSSLNSENNNDKIEETVTENVDVIVDETVTEKPVLGDKTEENLSEEKHSE